jgi:hypothetical protein
MGGNSGGGQKKMKVLENEHPRSFSSVVEVDCWQRRGALMPFQAESEFGSDPSYPCGVTGVQNPNPNPNPKQTRDYTPGFFKPVTIPNFQMTSLSSKFHDEDR